MYSVNNNNTGFEDTIRRIPKIEGGQVSQIIDQFASVQDFSIGTSPPKFVAKIGAQGNEEEKTMAVESSFCGQIKKFYLLKKDLSEPEMEHIAQKMKARSENIDANKGSPIVLAKPRKSIIFPIFGSKTIELMDYEQFEAQSLLNLNTLADLKKIGPEEENQWTSVSTHSIINVHNTMEKSKNRLSFFDRKVDKKQEITAKGVTYLEKSRFEDVLFSIGNVEIILYAFELLNQFDDDQKFENEERHKILCEIIRILEVLCKSSSREDVLIFLSQQNGFQFIARLLKNVIELFFFLSH